MNDAENDYSFLPSELDLERLKAVDESKDARVESENHIWVALHYAAQPLKRSSWNWCPWSLVVNHPQLQAHLPYEFRHLSALLIYLKQLESSRTGKYL